MPFKEERANAFATYTLSALMEKHKSKKVLTIARPDLAKVLGVEKLWDKHIALISKEAEKHDIGTANLGSRIAFVNLYKNKDVRAIDVEKATEITDQFEKLMGSKAADELWESGKWKSI